MTVTERSYMSQDVLNDIDIIEQLFARDERALDEVARKYSRLYLSMLRELLCDASDVEECGNDVLLALWNRIPPDRPIHLPAYICTIARRIGINRYHHNTRKKRGGEYTVMLSELTDCLPDRSEQESADVSERIGRVVSDVLRELQADARVLFVRRYFYMESVTQLAERFGMSENVISVKLYRARKKLKKALEQEEIEI